MSGQANEYYNQNGQQYGAPQGPPPDQQQYQQPPPNYGQNHGPKTDFNGEKPTFDQAFKIDKPKWNDLWAGALLIAVFAGYVAVSGIAIQGYGDFVSYRFPKLILT